MGGIYLSEWEILTEAALQALVSGLLLGAMYGLMCFGLALIFGIMRVVNFAQGDFMMMGMFFALFIFSTITQPWLGSQLGPYLGHVDKWRIQRRIDVMSMKPRKLSAVLS
ncbi:hypothetical protein [Paracoccus sp. SCSIO 75233]|uniref:ABC transporter permease subunit n=1 Tax=Paracoccus sp. SCSIO 75233 TaxID=3017782 RepID=UPI00349FD6DE